MWYSGITSACQAEVEGSIPFICSKQIFITMFYEQIPIDEIPKNIVKLYNKVKPFIGQLIINNCEIYRFVGILRDDKFDGEWCYRILHFPSFNSENDTQVSDSSILCGTIIPLKGFIGASSYKEMERLWKLNEERCPYKKDYFKVE